jgi:hypothetical protein
MVLCNAIDVINLNREDLIETIIPNAFITEKFLVRKMNEYNIDMLNFANEKDKLEISIVIDKFKSWIEIVKNSEKIKNQSTSYIERLISNRLRIDEIASREYIPRPFKSKEVLEYNLEALEQHKELFDAFVKREDNRIKLTNKYVDACISSNDVAWIYPKYNQSYDDYGYPGSTIHNVIISTLKRFLTNNSSYNKSVNIIDKYNNRCIEQIKLFDEQPKNILDIDRYYMFEKIVKELKNIAAIVSYAGNDYRYNTALFHRYVLKNIESTKVGIEYILTLEEVVISCSARLILLERELPENTTNSDLSNSKRYVNECDRCINAYTNNVIKAIEHVESLKCDMIYMHNMNNDYIALAKKIAEYAKDYEIKFVQMINELFSLESLLNRQVAIVSLSTIESDTDSASEYLIV